MLLPVLMLLLVRAMIPNTKILLMCVNLLNKPRGHMRAFVTRSEGFGCSSCQENTYSTARRMIDSIYI